MDFFACRTDYPEIRSREGGEGFEVVEAKEQQDFKKNCMARCSKGS